MSKPSSIFLCSSCGNEFPKWSGQCPACKNWNTLSELKLQNTSSPTSTTSLKSTTPSSALKTTAKSTLPSQIGELDRVLGPGLTQGGVYLLAGEPGIGKSTLLTQLTLALTSATQSSEENAAQVATRINRLQKTSHHPDRISLLETSNVEAILKHLNTHPSTTLIVDSIQSVASDTLSTTAGSMSQIRSASNLLIHFAKSTGTPTILVGHVTKSGQLAGPKLLEHMVDVVLQLEGDRHHDLRLLRGVKNRFGPTDETGLFQMTSSGLIEVKNPGSLFLSDQSPLLVEIQALTVPTELAIPRRVAQGIPVPKLQLICAVLTKHLNLKLNSYDVFVNVTGGLRLTDPAADLSLALAIISSYKNLSLPINSLALGELGLLGEIRPIAYLDKRLKEAKNLGYQPLDPKINNLKKLSATLFSSSTKPQKPQAFAFLISSKINSASTNTWSSLMINFVLAILFSLIISSICIQLVPQSTPLPNSFFYSPYPTSLHTHLLPHQP